MATKGKLGQVIINDGKDVLVKEIIRMLPFTTVTLLGGAGTGKTTILEEVAEKASFIDELAILRLQGMSSEDFRMPLLVERKKKTELNTTNTGLGFVQYKPVETIKTVEFAKMGILREIVENPDRNYLIFCDEILRSDSSVAPLLFELLERKIDGIFRPNMFVVTAANYGSDEFIQNFDYSDAALRRRQIFIEYVPNKNDIVNFMYDHEYHPIIQELIESLDYSNIMDDSVELELEQTTQLGSWAMLNNRWKEIESENKRDLNYSECKTDLILYGSYMFNRKTEKELLNKLTLFESLNTIDIQKEIIENNGLNTKGYIMHDKKGKEFDYSNKKPELLVRTKYYIRTQVLKDLNYIKKYAIPVAKVFEGKPEIFDSLFKEIGDAFKKKAIKEGNPEEGKKNFDNFAVILHKEMVKVKDKDAVVKKIYNDFSEAIKLSIQGAF